MHSLFFIAPRGEGGIVSIPHCLLLRKILFRGVLLCVAESFVCISIFMQLNIRVSSNNPYLLKGTLEKNITRAFFMLVSVQDFIFEAYTYVMNACTRSNN